MLQLWSSVSKKKAGPKAVKSWNWICSSLWQLSRSWICARVIPGLLSLLFLGLNYLIIFIKPSLLYTIYDKVVSMAPQSRSSQPTSNLRTTCVDFGGIKGWVDFGSDFKQFWKPKSSTIGIIHLERAQSFLIN